MISRTPRIRGQVRAIERTPEGDSESEDVLQLVASCRGALHGLMAGLIEGQVKFHVLSQGDKALSSQVEAAEELMAVVRRYFS